MKSKKETVFLKTLQDDYRLLTLSFCPPFPFLKIEKVTERKRELQWKVEHCCQPKSEVKKSKGLGRSNTGGSQLSKSVRREEVLRLGFIC